MRAQVIAALKQAALVLIIAVGIAGCARESTDSATTGGIALVVGTYPGEVNDSDVRPSQGLYSLRLDAGTGRMQTPRLLAELENPSYVAVDGQNQRLYAVSEVEQGEVVAYQWEPDQPLRLINRVTANGASPCYVALSPTGRQLAVANYMTGNIAVYDIDKTSGAISESFQQRRHEGRGPNPERQEAPHAHWVQWDPAGEFLYVVDLGIDKVMGYPVDRATGELGEAFVALEATPGAGPRHMAFHPRRALAFVLNELDNSLLLAGRNPDGTLTPLQRLTTLPSDFSGHSQAAHIATDFTGSRVYVSNRGHDSIAMFELSDAGKLNPAQWVGTGGDWPRHFSLLAEQNLLVVANQHSHDVQLFRLNSAGLPELAGPVATIARPTFVEPLVMPPL